MLKNYNLKNLIVYGFRGRYKRFREIFLKKLFIDETLINKAIKEFGLDDLNIQIIENYKKLPFPDPGENKEYFGGVRTFHNANIYLPENPFFLYPPNVAVIDFFLKNFDKNINFLDYGCGLGNLLIYLRRMGFTNAYGYDNFSQVSKKTCETFLDNFEAKDILLGKKQAFALKTKVISCICYFWNKLEKDLIKKELENKDLEYILIDRRYTPFKINNFKMVGVYKNLLTVYKRKNI